MIAIDFFLFTIYGVQNAYLPLFLMNLGFSPSELGFLYGIFNIFGIILPFLLTPLVTGKNRFSTGLLFSGLVLTLIPMPLFHAGGFWLTGLFMALYAVFYRWLVPLSDALITSRLGSHQERYGIIRVAGSAGFVLMTLTMQKFCRAEEVTVTGMILWMTVPALLFTLSVAAFLVYCRLKSSLNPEQSENKHGPERKIEEDEVNSNSRKSFFQLLKSFGFPFWVMMTVIFFEFFGMVPANNFLSMYVSQELKIDSAGLLWAISSSCEIPFMFFSGYLIKRFGEKPLILICTVFVTVRNLLYAFIPTFTGAILGQVTHCLTYGLFFPAGIMFCTKAARSDSKKIMVAMTVYNSLSGLAAVAGASSGGVIIDYAGYKNLFLLFSLFPLCSVVFALIIGTKNKWQRNK